MKTILVVDRTPASRRFKLTTYQIHLTRAKRKALQRSERPRLKQLPSQKRLRPRLLLMEGTRISSWEACHSVLMRNGSLVSLRDSGSCPESVLSWIVRAVVQKGMFTKIYYLCDGRANIHQDLVTSSLSILQMLPRPTQR